MSDTITRAREWIELDKTDPYSGGYVGSLLQECVDGLLELQDLVNAAEERANARGIRILTLEALLHDRDEHDHEIAAQECPHEGGYFGLVRRTRATLMNNAFAQEGRQ